MRAATDQRAGPSSSDTELAIEQAVIPLTDEAGGIRRDRQLAVIVALLRRAAASQKPESPAAEKTVEIPAHPCSHGHARQTGD
jgi:hypothetical protein